LTVSRNTIVAVRYIADSIWLTEGSSDFDCVEVVTIGA
jgi:hypothetical protein